MHLFNSLAAKFPLFIASLGLFVSSVLGLNQTVQVVQTTPVTPPPLHTTVKTPVVVATSTPTTKPKPSAPAKATIPTQTTTAAKEVAETPAAPSAGVPQTADLSS